MKLIEELSKSYFIKTDRIYRFKIFFSMLIFCIMLSHLSASQTYYNPKDEINITLTIKEPFKPINYSEIGENFNNTLQAEAARRESLKAYYQQIYYETKSSVIGNTYLTDNTDINNKLLLLQNTSIEYIETCNRLLNMGMIKPNEYEYYLRNHYINYVSANQYFLNLSRMNYLKLQELKSDSSISKYNFEFKSALNSIVKFEIQDHNIMFFISGLAESSTSKNVKHINQINQFVSNVCANNYESYKKNWEQKEQERETAVATAKKFNDKWKKMCVEIVNSRRTKLSTFSVKDKTKYLKEERQYLNQKVGESYMNWYFGKGRRFVNSVDLNTSKFINILSDTEESAVKIDSPANKFYKAISEFCSCGNYNTAIFNE